MALPANPRKNVEEIRSSQNAMRVSVAMCTYNGEKYLSEQLQSVAAQTIEPHQVVVCDDGSTDHTVQILEDFARTVPFQVSIFRNTANLGYTKNFEKAIGLCDGDVIALSDQDDIWYPEKLEALCSILEEDRNIGAVFSDADLINSQSGTSRGTLWKKYRFNSKQQHRFQETGALEVLLQRAVVTGMTLIFRADLRDKLLPIPSSWEHDGWLAFILVLTSRLEFTRERLVKYRLHESQQISVPEPQVKKLSRFFHGGISDSLNAMRAQSVKEYARTQKKIDDLLQRLTGSGWDIDSRQLRMIQGKAEHSRIALEILATSRSKRIGEMLKSFGAYRRYSPRFYNSMIKDLVC